MGTIPCFAGKTLMPKSLVHSHKGIPFSVGGGGKNWNWKLHPPKANKPVEVRQVTAGTAASRSEAILAAETAIDAMSASARQ
jgi:hypothetical protein